MRNTAIPVIVITACALAQGQTFDAASIKPASPPAPDGRNMFFLNAGPTGGPGTKDPGRIHYPFTLLADLLTSAYDVKNFQITGPAWLDSERFDITATMPPTTTREQFRVMLRNLLAERFRMKVHRETKELPLYLLVVGKNGPKIKESAAVLAPKDSAGPAEPPPLAIPKTGADGFPILPQRPPGSPITMIIMNSRARFEGRGNTMQDLASRLTAVTNCPVKDATELRGKYDFTLTFAHERMIGPMGPMTASATPDPDALPDIFSAIQAQLGLKLEAKKGPVEIIVIDRIEKTPTAN